jgi:hypothetical protein
LKMIDKPYRLANIPGQLVRRPLSCISALIAVLVILYSLDQLYIGNTYVYAFNYIDGTTLIMLGVLLVRGITSLWRDTDLQAVSIALIGALSFVFAYEAIYKLSFFILPWRMPPAEFREFVIQAATALTVMVGFAFGKFRVSRLSWIFAGIFVIGWIIWLAAGFPQIYTGANYFTPLINFRWTKDLIYGISRGTKISVFLVYYFFYNRRTDGYSPATDAPQTPS